MNKLTQQLEREWVELRKLRESEQQAQQEPEWYHFVRYGEDCFVPYSGQAPEKATPLYTSPQRTWVGLTLEDMETTHWSPDFRAGAKWAAAKLKEKNT